VNIESDQIHIVAICNAIGVTCKVVYLDSSSTDVLNTHTISPMNEELPGAPVICLLYRPGHYDILYE
jgi:ubiquitin thioesterase protein OTUB1